MVLWYTAVLTAVLVLFGAVLYITVSKIVLDPVSHGLEQSAQGIGRFVIDPALVGGQPCAFPDGFHGDAQGVVLWACFDSRGRFAGGSRVASALPAFASGSLAARAASDGSAQDTVTIDNLHIERYALAVPGSNGTRSVIMVGADISGQLRSLHALQVTLLILGAVMLVASTVAGYFLAGRSLVPVRAAQLRQKEFIADAAHELRTPLTLLRADAEVLLRGKHQLPPEDSELLDDVVHEADHMAGLADSMLQLARLDSGAAHIERDVVDLSEVAHGIARRATARAAELGIAVEVHAEGRQVVLGDSLLINQAALALVDNALKYNEPGGHLLIEVAPADSAIDFRVRDTGTGISGEHIAHLGKRFYRVDKARSRAMGGAGLGLSIVSRIAAQHGGKLSIESEPGLGTTASICFPRP
jgi:signal transduction histidine kinase